VAPAAPSDDFSALTAMPLPAARELALADKERLGDGGVRVERAWLLHPDGTAGATFRVGDWAVAVLLVRARHEVRGASAPPPTAR
jgi:3'-phosphoadenosine 5'-phosphosulfate (PAPS) 3'-phosphatase